MSIFGQEIPSIGRADRLAEARVLQNRIDSERRRYQIENSRDILGTEHVVKGRTQLQGAGEATINLSFPVSFVEPPTFTFGGELAVGSVIEAGQFPIISCCISAWGNEGQGAFRPDAPTDVEIAGGALNVSLREYYQGAVVACVATGPSAQNVWIHWMFTGVAVSNPITGGGGVSSTVPADGTVGATI